MVSALQYIVHVKRFEDGVRRIASIAEITGLEALTPLTQEIFRFERRGRKGQNVLGEFCGTGTVPRLVDELKDRDITVPMNLFRKPQGSSVHG
jgi:pilus assembly protein CpaF